MGSPQTDRELVRRHGFKKFIELAWDQIEGLPLILEPHIPLIANHYEMIARADKAVDMVVNVPPGTSKSTIGSVLFQPWAWTLFPWLKFIHTGYDQDLSHTFARRSLALIQSPWYQERWPLLILNGQRASVSFFENEHGGTRFSTMMGGSATGRHGHILIADDPHKPDDLEKGGPESAKLALDTAWSRWVDTFSTRRADAKTFKRVVVMQRLHVDDVAGRMLREPDCIHLCLPMEFEPARAYESEWGSDWRTEPGELLSPLRFPAEVMAKEKLRMTARAYASQHQQRPTPEAGALFQREWFSQRWSALPSKMSKMIMSVDTSLKEGKDSDYCVIQVWGMAGAAEFYLIDQTRARMSFSSAVEAIRAMKRKWPQIGNVLIEDKANGTAIVDTLKRSVPGVLAVSPEGGKIARANAVEPFLRAMNVWFPNRPWTDELVEEAISFPVGSHDDQVDAMSQALLWLSGKTRAALRKRAMANVRRGHVFR